MSGNDLSPLPRHRALELFAGIGGFATACSNTEVVAAIDINRHAERVYLLNHQHPYWVREIESMSNAEFSQFEADFWWMSPPCQPFSRRGAQSDDLDARTRPLLRLLDAITHCRPTTIALENVVGFETSRTYRRLRQVLSDCGYYVVCLELCPSQLGWPNRRPRFYLLATRRPVPTWRPYPDFKVTLKEMLGNVQLEEVDPTLVLGVEEFARYRDAIDRVDPMDAKSITACFAGSYGKTLLHAGSYMQLVDGRYRRFSPSEVAKLLGFPEHFRFDGMSNRAAWKLLGNSLSIPAVRYVVSHTSAQFD